MGAFEPVVHLHPSIALANEAIKRSAVEAGAKGHKAPDASNLGSMHTTPMQLASSEWELWGDGRTIASDAFRLMGVYGLLEEHGLQVSIGTASQISALLKGYLHEMEKAGFAASGLTDGELSVCELARDYNVLLEEHDAIELCQALPLIHGRLSSMQMRMSEPCVMDEPLHSFFEGLVEPSGECETQVQHPGDDAASQEGTGKASEREAPGDAEAELFVMTPKGATATFGMALDEARRAIEDGSSTIAIVAPDPFECYKAISPSLRNAGAICFLDARVPFRRSSFGRFFLSACKLLSIAGSFGMGDVLDAGGCSWIDVATDVALSEYARIEPFESSSLSSIKGGYGALTLMSKDLNAVWRMDRTLTPSNAVSDLMSVSRGFRRVIEVLSPDGDRKATLEAFAEEAGKRNGSLASHLDKAAVSSLQSLLDVAESLKSPLSYLALFADQLSIPISVIEDRGCAHDGIFVAFSSYDGAASLAPSSFDETIVCDVSDAWLNAMEAVSSIDGIVEKFGGKRKRTKLERSRQAFLSAKDSARIRFACIFPLMSSDGEESFSSFAFDELIDSKFNGELSSKEIVKGMVGDGDDAISQSAEAFLRDSVIAKGEEDVVSGIGWRFDRPESWVELPIVARGALSYLHLPDFLTRANIGESSLIEISASAIETYLGCPYKWFVERVIRPKGLDEGFGTLEAGNFAHALLAEFYARLIETTGFDRVGDGNRNEAAHLFREVADALSEAQYALPPGSGRYVPITNVEGMSRTRLESAVFKSIQLYSCFPEGMSLRAMEWGVGNGSDSAQDAVYAGFALNGKVDRVDVGDGSFTVIDYKGGLSGRSAGSSTVRIVDDESGPEIDPSSLPAHVQSLVYAQSLKRLGSFGNDCRAALYATYRASSSQLVSGSLRSDDTELASIADAKSKVAMGMDAFLAMIENAVEKRLDGIRSSSIEAEPSSGGACTYCPVDCCEAKRR